jgi:RimJ/RimL family protein N-acetyltransferase
MITELHTPRLHLLALTLHQLELCLDDLPALEAELGFLIAREIIDGNLIRALGMKIVRMEKLPLEKHPWQTYWLIVLRPRSLENIVGAGFVGFKGYLNAEGETEIGYGIAPQYQGKGYMTEAVRALCDWAFEHPGCRAVTATTAVNPASDRVLEKVGAVIVAQDEKSVNWKIYRPGSQSGQILESGP